MMVTDAEAAEWTCTNPDPCTQPMCRLLADRSRLRALVDEQAEYLRSTIGEVAIGMDAEPRAKWVQLRNKACKLLKEVGRK